MNTKNKQKRKEYTLRYYLRNKEKIRNRNMKWNKEHKDKLNEIMRIRRQTNKVCFIKYKWNVAATRIKTHINYQGLTIENKENIIKWAMNNPEFHNLFDGWVKSGWINSLNPVMDRLDNTKGYMIDNLRWITKSENSKCQKGHRHE